MSDHKYILELLPTEVKALHKAIQYLHDENLGQIKHFCNTVIEQEHDTPCTLLSTNPLDQMSTYTDKE